MPSSVHRTVGGRPSGLLPLVAGPAQSPGHVSLRGTVAPLEWVRDVDEQDDHPRPRTLGRGVVSRYDVVPVETCGVRVGPVVRLLVVVVGPVATPEDLLRVTSMAGERGVRGRVPGSIDLRKK